MDHVTKISNEAAPAAEANPFMVAMAVMCGLAFVVCVCIATSRVDMSAAGFF